MFLERLESVTEAKHPGVEGALQLGEAELPGLQGVEEAADMLGLDRFSVLETTEESAGERGTPA